VPRIRSASNRRKVSIIYFERQILGIRVVLCSIVPINRDIFVTGKLSVLNFQKVSLNLTCSRKSSKRPPAPHRLI
jgi:hypothetical protein